MTGTVPRMTAPAVPRFGIEEEFHLVDPRTRATAPDAGTVLEGLSDTGGGQYEKELHQAMVETGTAVCSTLAEARSELERLRAGVARAAAAAGRCVAAAGSVPLTDWSRQHITPSPRYRHMVEVYREIVGEQLVCGCHVHVGFSDRDRAVAVLNRVRPWLPVLLALSASSPFWTGRDTGYASYRTQVWGRWPSAGMPGRFASAAEYDRVVATLIDAGGILDAGMLYWDVRLSAGHETLEFRTADVCTTVDEAVLHAGLVRALASTCDREAERGAPIPPVRDEVLRAARWRAARYGVEGDLIDAVAGRAVQAGTLVEALLDYVGEALDATGDRDAVVAAARRILREGTSSTRQRRVFRATGRLEAVLDHVIAETAGRSA